MISDDGESLRVLGIWIASRDPILAQHVENVVLHQLFGPKTRHLRADIGHMWKLIILGSAGWSKQMAKITVNQPSDEKKLLEITQLSFNITDL